MKCNQISFFYGILLKIYYTFTLHYMCFTLLLYEFSFDSKSRWVFINIYLPSMWFNDRMRSHSNVKKLDQTELFLHKWYFCIHILQAIRIAMKIFSKN